MTIFDTLSLLGGIAMFLFGMKLMGNALEKRAGGKFKTILEKLTSNTFKGFLLGALVTAVIQSSSATTVMVVGFVNSGVMTLSQSVGIIMGANFGTTITAWILSLSGIQGDNVWIQLLEPSSFVPVIAFVGIILYMFVKDDKKKDYGMILLGFAVLMMGMSSMSQAVEPLAEMQIFGEVIGWLANPFVGIMAGLLLTALIQSSSASTGILQALSMTGSVNYAAAFPVILGNNIGACVSAMLSSIGARKNAKRAAFVHLYFNIFGALFWLIVFYIIKALVHPSIIASAASPVGIAIVHSSFKLLCVVAWAPFTKLLEKLACLTVRDSDEPEETSLLDERFFTAPAMAIERSKTVASDMASISCDAVLKAFDLVGEYNEETAKKIRDEEQRVDAYEDALGTYLVKLSNLPMSDGDSLDVSKMLHTIGDFERISDHAANIVKSIEEVKNKKIAFSPQAQKELAVITGAVREIVELALKSYLDNDIASAHLVEPLEQVVDHLKSQLKKEHILRLKKGECTIELGFILNDILTDFERVSDHCSNIAVCVIEIARNSFDTHEYLHGVKSGGEEEFNQNFEYFTEKYAMQ